MTDNGRGAPPRSSPYSTKFQVASTTRTQNSRKAELLLGLNRLLRRPGDRHNAMPTSKISLEKGRPKSKARSRQTQITQLDSPVRAVARSVISRASPVASSRKRKREVTYIQTDSSAESDREATQVSNKSDRNSDTAYKSSPISTQRSLGAQKPRRQTKLNFGPVEPGRFKEPSIDSDEEECRATQLAPRASQSDHKRTPASRSKQRYSEQRSAPAQVTMIDSNSDSDDLITPSRRRERFRSTGSEVMDLPGLGKRRSRQSDELDIEARDLDDNIIKIGSSRRSAKSDPNSYRSKLELLRRKKQGLASAAVTEYVEEDVSVGSGSESSFIVEDDADAGDYRDQLPADFQQPRTPLEQFKIAVQWEILDILLPQGGTEPDAYFAQAIQWLRDQTQNKSQAATSSIWRRHFLRAMQRGPSINAMETGNLGLFCDACGRTNRIATYVVMFEGARYDRLTLEDLDSDAESSEDDLHVDEDAASDVEVERARQERIMRQEWNLGVNCYERTCVAHQLYHLRKHMRDAVFEKLDSMDLFSAQQKYARSIMTQASRVELANQVTEQLDRDRFQQNLWSHFRHVIESGDDFIVDPTSSSKRRSKFLR